MIQAKDISILVVDDDPELLDTITSLFSIFGFEVEEARGGVPAWEKLQTSTYDIVITDVKMPDMNGVELLKKIRERDHLQPKVLLISGYSDYTLEDLLNLGANGFFGKPFNATSVRDSLTQTLLAPADKWSMPIKKFGAERLEKKINSLKDAEEDHVFHLGQSGFFFHMDEDIPGVGEHVDFEIHIKDGKPFSKFSGSGLVRWTRTEQHNESRKGVGVRIDYLEESCLRPFIEWVETTKPIPTIPKN